MSQLRKGVRGGTVSGNGPSLCRSCRFSTWVQGASESQMIVNCSMLEKTLPFEAFECGSYSDKTTPTKAEYYDIAWILRTDPKSKGQWGFVSPQERQRERAEGKPTEDADKWD